MGFTPFCGCAADVAHAAPSASTADAIVLDLPSLGRVSMRERLTFG
jgi:hypothetical protein